MFFIGYTFIKYLFKFESPKYLKSTQYIKLSTLKVLIFVSSTKFLELLDEHYLKNDYQIKHLNNSYDYNYGEEVISSSPNQQQQNLEKNSLQIQTPTIRIVTKIRGGDRKLTKKETEEQKLIESVIDKSNKNKASQNPSFNKILKKLVDNKAEIVTNQKLMQLISQAQRLLQAEAKFVADVFTTQNPIIRQSIENKFDRTRCYLASENQIVPQQVIEFYNEHNAPQNLAQISFKNPRVSKDYEAIKTKLKKGIQPMFINTRSTWIKKILY